MKLLVGFLVLSFQSSLAQEVPKTLNTLLAEGSALVNAEKYGEAAQVFHQALTVAENSGIDSRELLGLIGSMASAYVDAGQYSEAEHACRDALAIVEKTEGPESLDYALLPASSAALPTRSGDSERTIATIRKAISVNRNSTSYRELAVAYRCLAEILMAQKSYGEAEELLLDSQADFARLKTPDRYQWAAALQCLGSLRYQQGRFAESMDPFQESLTLLEAEVGTKHSLLVISLNNIATSLVKLGRMEEAGSAYQRAIVVCDDGLVRDHSTCGTLLGNYWVVLRKLGHKQEAKQLAARSRQIELSSNRRNGVGSVVSLESLRSRGN